MSKYKCIIFDCDGVLVDSEPISNGVLVKMANEYGANIDLSYALKNFKGGSLKSCVKKIEILINCRLPETFENDYRKKSFEAFKKNIRPINGIKEVLNHLNVPFCVASSGPRSKIEFNLNLVGLLDDFQDKIFSCYDINIWKPDPEIFLLAAKTMGFKPDECLVVEDSLSGVYAAINGGFDVFGYTEHDHNNELEGKATLTFNNMGELLELLALV